MEDCVQQKDREMKLQLRLNVGREEKKMTLPKLMTFWKFCALFLTLCKLH